MSERYMTGYDLYCQWCQDHKRKPPTRKWWNWACAKEKREVPDAAFQAIRADQYEIDRERREGWGYDDH